MHHDIKIDASYWNAVQDGSKRFEIRCNDRGYQKGDTISFCPQRPDRSLGSYGPPAGLYEITYVTGFQQKDNWVVFGFEPAPQEKDSE